MIFVDGTSGFACTGTLINTPRFPDPFFMTANHCINNAAAASSLTTFWFYEETTCGSGVASAVSEQVSGGAELVLGNYNVDATLLKLNAPPPSRAVYAGWDRAPVSVGTTIYSISHPSGDTSRWAQGRTIDDDGRTTDHVQQFNVVQFSRGFIEGGSSGSGLFNLANGSLVFRGTLLGDYLTDPPYSCSNATAGEIIYSRFDIFEPQIDQYIGNTAQAPDDAPNRARDLFLKLITDPLGTERPLNLRDTRDPLVFDINA